MRILHLLASDTTAIQQNNFLAVAKALKNIGIEQCALIKNAAALQDGLEELGISFETYKFSGMFDLRTKQDLKKKTAEFKPHLIQSYSVQSANFATDLYESAKHIGLLAGNEATHEKIKSLCDGVFRIGYQKTEHERNLYTVPPLPPYSKENNPVSSYERAEYDTPDESPLLGAIVAFEKSCKLAPVLDALRQIPSAHLWIAGEGPERDHFKTVIRKKGLHDRAHILDPPEKPVEFLKKLDLYIIPEHEEMADILTPQAWANNVPVIIMAPSENSPAEDGKNAMFIPPGTTPPDIGKAIGLLLANKEKARELAHAGYKAYSQHFTSDMAVKAWLKAYKEVLVG